MSLLLGPWLYSSSFCLASTPVAVALYFSVCVLITTVASSSSFSWVLGHLLLDAMFFVMGFWYIDLLLLFLPSRFLISFSFFVHGSWINTICHSCSYYLVDHKAGCKFLEPFLFRCCCNSFITLRMNPCRFISISFVNCVDNVQDSASDLYARKGAEIWIYPLPKRVIDLSSVHPSPKHSSCCDNLCKISEHVRRATETSMWSFCRQFCYSIVIYVHSVVNYIVVCQKSEGPQQNSRPQSD